MGNQTTSGIVEEEPAKIEAPEKSQEVRSPDKLIKEESQTQIQENVGKADSQDADDEKSEIEAHSGSVNEECETQTDVKPNDSNLDEESSNFNNEEQDQLYTINGEMQNPDPNLNFTPQEAGGITSDLHEDQNMLVKHVVEKKEDESVAADTASVEGSSLETCVDKDSTPQEAGGITSDLQEDQNMLVKHVVEKKEDDLVVADTASVEGTLLETCVDKDCTPQEVVGMTSGLQQDQKMVVKEIDDHVVEKKEDDLVVADTASGEGSLLETRVDKEELGKHDDRPQEEQSNSFNALNDLQSIGLLDSSAEENERDELMMNELSVDDTEKSSYVDQAQPSDQEIKRFLISCSEVPQEMIKCDTKEYAVEIDCLEKVDILDEVKDTNEVHECGPIQTDDPIAVKENQEQKESTGVSILEDSESKARESTEKRDFGSNSRYTGVQKSPSFDFGLSFDARSEESDQTPLLYQDRTPMRSLSSCSNLRFQNRSVQTQYLGKSMQYEAVEVEKKTIRMERSNSESAMAPPIKLLNEESKADVITKGEQENSGPDKKSENGETISPRGSGKRKPRSSLFTTCICCTAAIS